jgi:hypothetical protein
MTKLRNLGLSLVSVNSVEGEEGQEKFEDEEKL